MKKIFFLASLILISIIKSTEDQQNILLPNIFDEKVLDPELLDIVDIAKLLAAEPRKSSESSRAEAIPKATPSGRRLTPSVADAQVLSSLDLAKMIGLFNAFKNFKTSSFQSQRSLSQASTPEKKLSVMVPTFSDFNREFKPVKLGVKAGSSLRSPYTNLQKLISENTPTIIYSPRHVFIGSKGGGKHHFQDFDELLAIADLQEKNLPFVKNNQSNQLMGIIATGKVEDGSKTSKTKFSSIFPLDQSPAEINKKFTSLNLQAPYAKGKIFGKRFQNNSLIMRFDDYFIVIDLDSTQVESFPDLIFANSIYPLFHLKAITEEDLSTPGKLIELVNYSILQEGGQWSENRTAQISSKNLNLFLRHALSSMDEFKTYALACSAENILINMPYDFARNTVNLEFENHRENLTKNMYRITLEIPKVVAAKRFNPTLIDQYCDFLTGD
jgi:hypothetical protein